MKKPDELDFTFYSKPAALDPTLRKESDLLQVLYPFSPELDVDERSPAQPSRPDGAFRRVDGLTDLKSVN